MKQRFNFCWRAKNSLCALLLVALALSSTGTAFADANGDYRSAASGNWKDTTTWQTFNGSIWVAAGSTPTSQKVTIQNSHTVAVTKKVSVNQVIVQFGGTITNAQNLSLSGSGTALDIFGTVHAEGLQTADDDTILTNTIWPLKTGSFTIVEPGGSVVVDGGDLAVDGTLLVLGGNVTTAAGDNLEGSGTLTISNGTVTVGAPGQGNDCSVRTVNMTSGLLILGRGFSPTTASLTGGTIQFNATQTGFQIAQLTYANVILNGTTMNLNLGNGNIVITGNLSITGTALVEVVKPLTAHSLTLGGITVGAGTWGGPLSGAANINATYLAPAVPGDFITVATGDSLLVTLPGQVFTSGVGNTGTASNQTAGAAFNLTLHAVGVGGNVVDTTYSGFKTITFSGPATAANGTAPSYTMDVTFTNGVASGIVTILTAAETTTITAAAADGTANGVASSSLTVVAGTMDHYALKAAAPQNATVAFPLTVTTQDPFNNPVTTDSATPVTLGSSTGHASFDSNPITLTNGVGTVSTTVSTAETVNLTATDPNGKMGALIGLLINPAPVSSNYRSATSGNWNSTATWQTFNGSIWVAAGSTPTTQKVTIQNGHTVAVTKRVSVSQVQVQFGGTITNAQNLSLSGSGTALDIFGTVHAEGLQTAEDDTILTNTIWPLATSTTSIVEPGGSVIVDGGDLSVDGTLLVLGGTVTTASGDGISGSGTMTISNGTVTVGVPAQPNAFEVRTFNMTGGLLILGRAFDPDIESMTGGTIQFTTTDSNFAIPQFTYANLILSGNLPMILNVGNGDTVINGNLRITGTTKAEVHAPFAAHSLTLGGTTVGAGTWGGPLSGAANINTTYFTPAVPGDFITVTAGKASTTNVVSVSANPSPTGSNVTLTATITAIAPGSGTPTSTVQFLADGSPVGALTALSGGVANLTINSLAHGYHSIAAQYAGDGNFFGSTNSYPGLLINSAPVAQTATYPRPVNFNLKIRIATLATNWSDADGDTINLTSAGPASTNGVSVSKDSTFIYYNSTNGSNPDQFSYVISDGFVSMSGMVNVAVSSAPGTALTATNQITFIGGVPTLQLAGIPGRTYYVQASTNLAAWVDISTNVAGTNGLWNVTDADATNHPSRFYRTSDQP